MKFKIKYFIITAIVITITVFGYSPSLSGDYFDDDYLYKFNETSISLKSIFTSTHSYAYRPIEKGFLMILQKSFKTTLPIHVSLLLLHLSLSVFILLWMQKQGFSPLISILAFSIMALSQANNHAVSSNDTFSQISGTIFGYLSIITFLSIILNRNSRLFILYSVSFLFFIISILCKETSLSVIPILIVISIILGVRDYSADKKKIFRYLVSLIPFVLAGATFLVLRKVMNLCPAEMGTGRYNIHLGTNIISFCSEYGTFL